MSVKKFSKKEKKKNPDFFVLPKLVNTFITLLALDASNPVVGSSKSKTDGLTTNSTPIATRFFSPPDNPRSSAEPM